MVATTQLLETVINRLGTLETKLDSMENNMVEKFEEVPQSICNDVKANIKCALVVDNTIDSVTYNDIAVEVNGDTTSHLEQIDIEFKSCDKKNPGILTINATDVNDSNHCYYGGIIVHCQHVNNDATNPWHNFHTDLSHWKVNGDLPFCAVEDGWYFKNGRGHDFIKALFDKGAVNLWANSKHVSMVGSPQF